VAAHDRDPRRHGTRPLRKRPFLRAVLIVAPEGPEYVAGGGNPRFVRRARWTKPRRGGRGRPRALCRPLRGCNALRRRFPWAAAHGYMLSPLRGWRPRRHKIRLRRKRPLIRVQPLRLPHSGVAALNSPPPVPRTPPAPSPPRSPARSRTIRAASVARAPKAHVDLAQTVSSPQRPVEPALRVIKEVVTTGAGSRPRLTATCAARGRPSTS
jgi:hypothetical protein